MKKRPNHLPAPGINPPFSTRARRHGLLLTGLLACLLPTRHSHAQAGSLDAGFVSSANKQNYCVVAQPDGKILLGGYSDYINGMSQQGVGVSRLNSDGSLDTGFVCSAPGTQALALQPDGKILVGGPFGQVDGVARSGIARVNADGTLDTGFDPGAGADSIVNAVAPAPGGKVILGGSFDYVNGVLHRLIARLNADGSLDTSFNSNAGTGQVSVYSVAVQPDGKVIVGGHLRGFDGVDLRGVVRLNTDGSLDTSFAASVATNNVNDNPTVYHVALQPDGKIVLGGDFTMVNGVARNNVARLNADGSLDTGFVANTDPAVWGLTVQPDGKVLLVGTFTQVNGVARGGIARLNADGSLDTGFAATSATGTVYSVAVQPDSKIVVTGYFSQVDGVDRSSIARFLGDTPAFFGGEVPLSQGVDYLAFPNGKIFGYYEFLSDPHYLYHFDLGFEYVFDTADGSGGVYLYDFKSQDYFYTSPTFSFPYLYDFGLQAFLYYYPDPTNPQRYNTDGVRYFYNFSTGKIISK